MTRPKEIHLEGMRGIAAIVVLVYHCVCTFFPTHGIARLNPDDFSLKGSILWGFMNGPSAVMFFFVLSGYVLTRRPIVTGDRAAVVEGVLKRWPRLVGPVLLAVLISYLTLVTGIDQKSAIFNIVGYDWILKFSSAMDIVPNLLQALKEGTFLTFFRGDMSYVHNLWTMRFEFVGSFIAFGLALILIELRNQRAKAIFVLGVVLVLAHYSHNFYVPFVAGVAIAFLKPTDRDWNLGPILTTLSIILCIYLAGYVRNVSDTAGPYLPIRWLGAERLPDTYFYTISAVLLLLTVESSRGLKRFLSGPVSRFLGRISFPIYLIHMVVVTSAGAVVFVVLEAQGEIVRGLGAMTVVIWLSVIASIPFAAFNDRWVAFVNAIVSGKYGARVSTDAIPAAQGVKASA